MSSGDSTVREIVRLLQICHEDEQAHLRTQLERLKADLRAAETTIIAMRSSTSWQLTRPLRWLTQTLRRR